MRIGPILRTAVCLLVCMAMRTGWAQAAAQAPPGAAQTEEIVWTPVEQGIRDQIRSLRSLADDVRAQTTRDLAVKIRKLPASRNKLRLAAMLSALATEGDFGHDTLQEVATTLAGALREQPVPWPQPASAKTPSVKGSDSPSDSHQPQPAAREPAEEYLELATLVRYEHVQAALDDPQFAAAFAQLEAEDRQREHPEFSLKDLGGKLWTFSDLRGKVVLVNFWATWCSPCRKEMPDLEALHERFQSQGLVILAISDEEAAKIEPFIRERSVTFPVLRDPDRKVNDLFLVNGIPKTFVYDREGKLVAQSIDMRTRKQFLEMLAKAGMK